MSREESKYGNLLEMTLCFASSQDEAHPVEALRIQAANSSGWQSSKHCSYPQELGFRFAGEVYLQHVRLLSHESKISSCVDVQIAEASKAEVQSGICASYEHARFKRLGYVRFTRNIENDCKARELKTIGVMHQCVYLKLILRRPHHNAYNIFEQVGVIGLRAYGKLLRPFNEWKDSLLAIRVGEEMRVKLEEMTPLSANERSNSKINNNVTTNNNSGSSNDSGNDRRTADNKESVIDSVSHRQKSNALSLAAGKNNAYMALLRRINEMKELKLRAVAEEDYDLADSLKQQIALLEPALSTVRQLEQEKIKAIEQEDYQRAKQLKQQIDGLQRGEINGLSGANIPTMSNSNPLATLSHAKLSTSAATTQDAASASSPLHRVNNAQHETGANKNSSPAHAATPVHSKIGHAIGKVGKSPIHKAGVLDNVAVASQGYYDVDKALMQEEQKLNGNNTQAAATSSSPTTTRMVNGSGVVGNSNNYGVGVASRNTLNNNNSNNINNNNSATLPIQGSGESWEQSLNNIIYSCAQDILAGTSTSLSSSTSSLLLSPQPLSSDVRSESLECEQVFGVYAAACLFGKRGQLREAAIRAIASVDGITAISPHCSNPLENLLLYCATKGHGFKDPVAGVVVCICEAIEHMVHGNLQKYAKFNSSANGNEENNNSGGSNVNSILTKLLPDICLRVGDANSKVRESVEKLLVSLAASSEFAPERIAVELLRGVNEPNKATGTNKAGGVASKANTNANACLSRINILSKFVAEYGTDHSKSPKAIDASLLLNKAVRPNLQHASVTVREAAIRLLAHLALLNNNLCQRVLEELKPAQRSLVDKQMETLRRDGTNVRSATSRPGVSAGKNMETHSMSIKKKNALPAQSNVKSKEDIAKVNNGNAKHNEQQQQKKTSQPIAQASSSLISNATASTSSLPSKINSEAAEEEEDEYEYEYEEEEEEQEKKVAEDRTKKEEKEKNTSNAHKQVTTNSNNSNNSSKLAGQQKLQQQVGRPTSTNGQQTKASLESKPESAEHKKEIENRALHTCQFCGEYNKNFNDAKLDLHYVRACPMLCPCPLCDQVTEISTLQQHLVNECEGKYLVKQCPRCHEAVQAEDLKAHIAARQCILAVTTHSVCPLCHKRFRSGVDGWRRHLAKAPGCPNNPRKYDGTGPVEE